MGSLAWAAGQAMTPEQADAVMDGPFGAALMEQLPAHNLAGLGYWELGFRQLTNSRRPVANSVPATQNTCPRGV